jgi:hypothetical protein
MPRDNKKSARRKSATRSAKRTMRAKPKEANSVKPQTAKNTAPAGVNRSEGIRLSQLAGRPTKEQFIRVYGERGPKMTWEERAAAGVPAEKFQAALASAMRK